MTIMISLGFFERVETRLSLTGIFWPVKSLIFGLSALLVVIQSKYIMFSFWGEEEKLLTHDHFISVTLHILILTFSDFRMNFWIEFRINFVSIHSFYHPSSFTRHSFI